MVLGACALDAISVNFLNVPAAGVVCDKQARGYRPELDVVRFLAFLLVFFHHLLSLIYLSPEELAAFANRCGWRVLLALQGTCAMGLCLFFALSAYLITDLLLDERQKRACISVRKFYVRRVLRIWPLYFCGIAIGIAIAFLLHQRNGVTPFVWYLLFAGNFFIASYGYFGNPMMPLWSISIEEQFYLIWPWAMRWFSRRGLMACSLFFIVVANITLWIFGQHHADTDATVWASTLVQFEMFATGILLALAKKHTTWRNPGAGSVLVLTGPLLWFVACFQFQAKQQTAISGPDLMIGYALIAFGCAAVLQGFCLMGPSRMPRWAAYLGKRSYGLYVFHVLAIEFTKACFGGSHGLSGLAASALVALLLTSAAAILSYEFLESPFLRLKRRFEIVHSRPV